MIKIKDKSHKTKVKSKKVKVWIKIKDKSKVNNNCFKFGGLRLRAQSTGHRESRLTIPYFMNKVSEYG
jgi:hypothetical protein